MKIGTLCSGAGFVDLGFKQAGFEVVYANDNNTHACDTYELNHGRIDRRSIHEVRGSDIPDLHLLWSSCPCQPFSLENNHRLGWADPRNVIPEYLRVLAEKLPSATAFENVAALARDPYFKVIVRRMRKLGYGVAAKILDAAELGVPQCRERVICVGLLGRSDEDARLAFPRKISPRIGVSGVCPHIAYVVGYKWNKHIHRPASLPMPTITASHSGMQARLHDGSIRDFTVEELLVLSSAPPDFKWPAGSSYTQCHARIGNGVPPEMARHIAIAIRDALLRDPITLIGDREGASAVPEAVVPSAEFPTGPDNQPTAEEPPL